MHVEQAIFTSARTRHTQGYHLTARSRGVGEEIAHALATWSPSHGALIDADVDAASLNYFPVSSSHAVLARTVYGGPEYSDRGGLQLVTRMLVFRREQLAGYAYNPLHLARVALALGHLRLSGDHEQSLEPIQLPDRTALADNSPRASAGEPTPELERLLSRLKSSSGVAVVGAEQPCELLEALFLHAHPGDRPDLSFTTGLKPSLHRKFRVQFLATVDSRLRGQLAAQGVECIDLAV